MARKPAPKTRTTSKDLPEPTPSALTFHPEFDRLFKDGVRLLSDSNSEGPIGYKAMKFAADVRMKDAEAYGRALVSTCERYFAGYITRQTWDTHMRHLWAKIDDSGLRQVVVRLVLPKTAKGGAR